MPSYSRLTREDFSIGWVCALDIELAAALAVLDEQEAESPFGRREGDPNIYHFGRIKDHRIVIACLPAGCIGTTSASVVATHMLQSFPRIRDGFGLMVGIGGGAPNLDKGRDIRLGDIVVSQPNGSCPGVVQYDFGKAMENGEFLQIGSLNSPPNILLCALSSLKVEKPVDLGIGIRNKAREIQTKDHRFKYPNGNDTLFEGGYHHIPKKASKLGGSSSSSSASGNSDNCDLCDLTRTVQRPNRDYDFPHIYYGTIASANCVMKDGVKRDIISAQTGALCFEMEAAGLMNDFPCLVIRGVCDYSDGHKNKSWQPYAALVAALFARQLLCVIPKVTNTECLLGRSAVGPILQWLAADSPQEEYDTMISDTVEGTCKWILEKEEYKSWKELGNREAQCLWIYGKDGMGKSVLAANIVKDLKESTFVPCAFYFSIRENLVKRDPLSILRSWLSQLATANSRAFEALRTMREGNEERTITEPELWRLFKSCVQLVGPCFLMVDGYDETSNDIPPRRAQVVGAREMLLRKVIKCIKGTQVHLVISSRDEVDIRREIVEFTSNISVPTAAIEVSPDETSHDLLLFCRLVVDDLLRSSTSETKEKIIECLALRSEEWGP
ncbi:hypothetical protein TWF730_001973 [Orbilia blumenaviensis]|uniref:Nephrocystin 3-like N-terminal domain-containing protein n=1 Tax=Orbilia blumenaviensis TaxID=1796055 RepID=A0AAV9UG37_9PEZI